MLESLFETLDRMGSRPTAYVLGIVFLAGWYILRSVRRLGGALPDPVEDDTSEPIERPRRRLPLD